MGNFWGSVHLRTEDRDAVRAAVEGLAAEPGLKFYVSPANKGWVAVFPQDHGQDSAVADAIAQRVRVPAFYLCNHDDDVFAYRFYRDGMLVDEYVSAPGYFDEADTVREEKRAGDPSRYADLLPKASPQEVSELLRRDEDGIKGVFAGEIMLAFAKMLGIANAGTAYDYLEQGEREGVKGWRQFVHVPADTHAKQKQARRDAADALKAQTDDLRRRGVLIAEISGKKNEWPVWCADHGGGGFFVSWWKFPRDLPSAIERVGPPWGQRKAEPVAFDVGGIVTAMATEHAGSRVAIATARGVELFDARGTGPAQLRIAEGIGATQLRLSGDDRLLLCITHDKAMLAATDGGEILASVDSGGGQTGAIHPKSAAFIVDRQLDVLLVPLDEHGNRGHAQPLFVGGRSALAASIGASMQQTLARFDPDKFEADARKQMEKTLAQLEKQFRFDKPRKGMPQIGVKDLGALRAQMEQQLADQVERFRNAARSGIAPPRQAMERMAHVSFSADGTLLFCGTDQGLRVFEWPQVLDAAAGNGDLRNPKFAVNTALRQPNGLPVPSHDSGVAHHALMRNELIFGGLDGVIRALDLTSGAARALATTPGGAAIVWLGFSGDGQALLSVCRPGLNDAAADPRRVNEVRLYLWDAVRLAAMER